MIIDNSSPSRQIAFKISAEEAHSPLMMVSDTNLLLLLQKSVLNSSEEQTILGQAFNFTKDILIICYWCIPLLAKYCQNEFFTVGQRGAKLSVPRSLSLTQILVIINADNYSCLNFRKGILQDKKFQQYWSHSQELEFIGLVLTKHPKSMELWAHRRWVIQQLIAQKISALENDFDLVSRFVSALFLQEKAQATAAVMRYPKNYYAWNFRMRFIQSYSAYLSSQRLEEDLLEMETLIYRDPSDHSAFHHRHFLLSVLQNKDPETMLKLLQLEFVFVERAILLFPGHESIWSHKRAVLHLWLTCENCFRNNQAFPFVPDPSRQALGACGEKEGNEELMSDSSEKYFNFFVEAQKNIIQEEAEHFEQISLAIDPSEPKERLDAIHLPFQPSVVRDLALVRFCATQTTFDLNKEQQSKFALAYERWLFTMLFHPHSKQNENRPKQWLLALASLETHQYFHQ